jgi:hypothetical protein
VTNLGAADRHLDRIHAAGGELALRGGRLLWIRRPLDAVARLYESGPPPSVLLAIARALEPWTCKWCGQSAETPDQRCNRCVELLHQAAPDGWRLGHRCWHVARLPLRARCGARVAGEALSFAETLSGEPCRRCVASVRAERDRSSR